MTPHHAVGRHRLAAQAAEPGDPRQRSRSADQAVATHNRHGGFGRMHGADQIAHHDLIAGQGRAAAGVGAAQPGVQRGRLDPQQQLGAEFGRPAHVAALLQRSHSFGAGAADVDDHAGRELGGVLAGGDRGQRN